MPLNVKVTFFLESVQSAGAYASASLGWTETWYGFGGPGTLDGWLTAPDVEQYILLRRRCLPANYRIAWLRVSDEANPRAFKLRALFNKYGSAIDYTLEYQQQLVGTARGQVQCALLVDMARLPTAANEVTHHRRFLLRALPADVINGNILNVGGPNWNAILAFFQFMGNHETAGRPSGTSPSTTTLGVKYQDPGSAGWITLPAVSATPGDARSITVAADVGASARRIRIRRVPDVARDLNRTWTVMSRTAGAAGPSILGRAKRDLQNQVYSGVGPGQYEVVAPLYGIFNQYTIIGLRNKKTGRLFRQLRGRSSAR